MLLQAKDGIRGKVIDLDTGMEVPKVISLNMETGELTAYRVDALGRTMTGADGGRLTYTAVGRFKFVPRGRAAPDGPRVRLGAAACARCKSPLTLPGDELCPMCNAKDRSYARLVNQFAARPGAFLLGQLCQHPGCSRPATHRTTVEVEVSGAVHNRYVYERGMTVGAGAWCAWHYQAPKLLDAKGEVVEELPDSTRPQ